MNKRVWIYAFFIAALGTFGFYSWMSKTHVKSQNVVHKQAKMAVKSTSSPSQKMKSPTTSSVAPASPLPASIKPGDVAMSIDVNEVQGVSGYLTQGSHVDVVSTNKKGTTQIVLNNLRVLAVGPKGNKNHSSYTVVTLQVTPPEVTQLFDAFHTGRFSLLLRPTEATSK